MEISLERKMLLKKEYYKYCVRSQPVILCREQARRHHSNIRVLALDLERTITTSVDPETYDFWARPHLFNFLESVKDLFERIVIFTAVREDVFRIVAKSLEKKKKVPAGFAEFEYIQWPRTGKKDLQYISGIEPHEAILVDDYAGYIHYEQLFQWIKVDAYEDINFHFDRELPRVLGILRMIKHNTISKESVLEYLEPYVDNPGSGIKRAWLYGSVAQGKADAESIIKIAIEIDDKVDKKRTEQPFGRGVMDRAQGEFERYYWGKMELIAYPVSDINLKEEIDNGIQIINSWEPFNVVFTREPDGIDIQFPDILGCHGYCPDDGTDHFKSFTLQAHEPAQQALEEWLKTATANDLPREQLSEENLRKQHPESMIQEIWVQLPWKKNNEKELLELAIKVFEDRKTAEKWLISKAPGLGDKIPIEFSRTPSGLVEVQQLLIRIEEGIFI